MKCMSCGTEMNSTTGGNYTCPKCGQGVNDGVYRPSINNIYGEPYLGWGQMGWICPKCGKVLAPWKAECDCHERNAVITDKSNITDKSDTPFNIGTSIIYNGQTPDVKYTCTTATNAANGVIVPPCKVGDTVYALYNGKVLKANIFSMKIETEDDKYVYMLKLKIFDHFFQFKTFLLGKTVFLTREEAEKALERSKGNAKEKE